MDEAACIRLPVIPYHLFAGYETHPRTAAVKELRAEAGSLRFSVERMIHFPCQL